MCPGDVIKCQLLAHLPVRLSWQILATTRLAERSSSLSDSSRKTEEVSLILPGHWQVWQATHSFSSEVDWLTTFKDGLGDVWGKIGKAQGAADLVFVDPLFSREFDD